MYDEARGTFVRSFCPPLLLLNAHQRHAESGISIGLAHVREEGWPPASMSVHGPGWGKI